MKDTAKFSPLNNELKEWIQKQLLLLDKYAESLDITFVNPLSSELMDDLWIAWKKTNVTDSDATDSFLNCFGIGFGQILVNQLGFKWTHLEDEYGSDIAVRALPGTADTRVVPLNFVLKRWESDEGKYIKEAVAEIDEILDEYAQEHGVER